jgi:hypothetical protein
LVNLLVNNVTNKGNRQEMAELFSAWLGHKDPMADLAVFKALGHENVFKYGRRKLVENIKLEAADPVRGSRSFALLCRHLRLDNEFNYSNGEVYEKVFRDLLVEIPSDIPMKRIFANLEKVRIPYDKEHELSPETKRKKTSTYLDYIGLNRLVHWATLSEDEIVRKRSEEILAIYMDEELIPGGKQKLETFIRGGDPASEMMLVF